MAENAPDERQKSGSIIVFDSAQFVIDEIMGDHIIGHYVLIKGGKDRHTLPRIRVDQGCAATLDGVTIRTKYQIKYINRP